MLLLVASTLVLSGCYKTKFQVQSSPIHTNQAPAYNEAQDYFLAGVGQEKDIDAAAICGGADKVAQVETQRTFLNGAVAFLVDIPARLLIPFFFLSPVPAYTPEQVRVYCTI